MADQAGKSITLSPVEVTRYVPCLLPERARFAGSDSERGCATETDASWVGLLLPHNLTRWLSVQRTDLVQARSQSGPWSDPGRVQSRPLTSIDATGLTTGRIGGEPASRVQAARPPSTGTTRTSYEWHSRRENVHLTCEFARRSSDLCSMSVSAGGRCDHLAGGSAAMMPSRSSGSARSQSSNASQKGGRRRDFLQRPKTTAVACLSPAPRSGFRDRTRTRGSDPTSGSGCHRGGSNCSDRESRLCAPERNGVRVIADGRFRKWVSSRSGKPNQTCAVGARCGSVRDAEHSHSSSSRARPQ
jgi:hypothetical protein